MSVDQDTPKFAVSGQHLVSRREFVQQAGAVADTAAGLGPFFLFPGRALAGQKTLKIAHWSHFLPAYDEWFGGDYVKEWGRQHDTNVIVDHVPIDKIHCDTKDVCERR
jgi:multiple sugar transport system substrate-binding protein